MLAAAVSLSGMVWLAGCEQQPYPTTAQAATEAPKPPPPLAGAPSDAPQPTPPAYTPPPPAPYSPPRGSSGVAIVAMAPIPNPGDPGSEGYYKDRHLTVVRGHVRHAAVTAPKPPMTVAHKAAAPKPAIHAGVPPVYAEAPPPKPPLVAAKAPSSPKTTVVVLKPAPKGYAGALTPTGPVKPYVPPKDYRPATPPPVAVKSPLKPAPVPVAIVAAGPVSPSPRPVAAAPASAPGGDRAAHVASLQSALADAISKGAVLSAPERFTANQPADVSLTVPAGFYDAVRTEAQKAGLSDSAASVNLTAVLSGDGFSVTPDETQSQPLTVGQATQFRWTVTAQPGAKGPLHADIGADLLGGGSDTLALGSVQKQAPLGVKATPRIIGAAILVLILAVVVVWLARGRGPTRSANARRASQAARAAPADATAAGS
jgi:hypothetical protein